MAGSSISRALARTGYQQQLKPSRQELDLVLQGIHSLNFFLEDKLSLHSHEKWLNNENFWNESLAFSARQNISQEYGCDPNLAIHLLKKTYYYPKVKEIASNYGYYYFD